MVLAAIRTNGVAFRKELAKEKRDANRDFELFHQKIALEWLKRTVLRCPVRTGLLRGSFFLSNTIADDEPEGLDPSGARAIGRGIVDSARLDPFGTSYLISNVDYAGFVEDGTDRMEGFHMMATSAAELEVAFDRIVDVRRIR